MKKREFHDDEEREQIAAYERGEFRPARDQKGAKLTALQAARRYKIPRASVLSGKKEG